ncbi:Alpha/Beta hydrolase protein, partial [Apiosordaria backusii]
IIAIHGLNGHAFRTWTKECPASQPGAAATGTMWLRDLLPSRLPDARIMTYGYDSRVFSGTKADVLQDAEELLSQLRAKREDLEVGYPILFIAHSLGGLVLKQALCVAKDHSEYGELFEMTRGITFMGTPHRGSGVASPALILASILRVAGLRIAKQRLRSLQEHSKSLFNLSDQFRRITAGISILSFYETKPTPPLSGLVVQPNSAILGLADEIILPLEANHRDICRFADDQDGGLFDQVALQLILLIEAMKTKGTA